MAIAYLIGVIIIAGLWLAGGQRQSWTRDWIIPFIVGGFSFINHHTGLPLWKSILFAVLVAGACNIIRLGYGNYSPEDDDKPSLLALITKDRSGWWIRGIYGVICGVVSFIPNFIFDMSLMTVVKAISFTTLFAVVCFTVVRLRSNVVVTDLLIGATFGMRIFL